MLHEHKPDCRGSAANSTRCVSCTAVANAPFEDMINRAGGVCTAWHVQVRCIRLRNLGVQWIADTARRMTQGQVLV